MKIQSFLLFLFFCLANISQGQIYPSVTFSSDFDDNINRSPIPESDQIYSLDATIEYAPESSNFSLYYSGNWEFYKEYVDRNANYQDFGMYYMDTWGKKDQNRFYIGGNFLLKNNTKEFNYYDYNQFYLYGNLRFKFESFLLKGGYNYRNREYVKSPSLNNARHYLFMHGSKTFSTRTTMQLEGNLGLKTFASDEFIVSGPGSGGGGGGMRPYQVETEDTQPDLSHFILVAKIGQAVMDELGLSFTYRQQISLTPESTFSNPDYRNLDSELFDDPFSYESKEYKGSIKAMLPWSINLDLSGGFAEKDYLGDYAYISETDTIGLGGLRKDEQKYISFSFDKSLVIDKSLLYSIVFIFDYYYLINESNSYWYDYKNQYYSLGINFNF